MGSREKGKSDAAGAMDLETRYMELLRLQKRANVVLDTYVEQSTRETDAAEEALEREIDKFLKLDADPEVFKAVDRAAYEAPGSEDFSKLARETAAKLRLQIWKRQNGPPSAFRDRLDESEKVIKGKQFELSALDRQIQKLVDQLEPVRAYNRQCNHFDIEVTHANRQTIEDSGFWKRVGEKKLRKSYSVVTSYSNTHNSNCFDDMLKEAELREQRKDLAEEIEYLREKRFANLASYSEVRNVLNTLEEAGLDENAKVDVEEFHEEFSKRLHDKAFMTSFAHETPSGVAGNIILAALNVEIRRNVQESLTSHQKATQETAVLLEGPIGTIATSMGASNAIDGIERDLKSQVLMTGYLCESAAGVSRSLSSFRPEHTEGPVSLMRDIQLHMASYGEVDPSFIKEFCGMDSGLAAHFNVNAVHPQPDFAKVLGTPDEVERMDRVYAGFLRENAAFETAVQYGFSAGQFNLVSVEQFLDRYFGTGESLVDALQNAAQEVEKIEEERKARGILNLPKLDRI